MTTIVIRNNKLAIDTCCSNAIRTAALSKLVWGPKKQWVGFGAGNRIFVEYLIHKHMGLEWNRSIPVDREVEYVSFYIARKGKEPDSVGYAYEDGEWVLDNVSYVEKVMTATSGSGATYFLGALLAGATTKEAVNIVSELDLNTNNKFQFLDLVTLKTIKAEEF